MNRAHLKEEAKKQFRAQYWPCVGVQAVVMLISTALMWITGSLDGVQTMFTNPQAAIEGAEPSALLMLLVSLLTGIVSIEVSFFYLRVFRGEKVPVGEFFAGLAADVGRKAGAFLWQILFLSLWGMAGAIPLGVVFLLVPTPVAFWLTMYGLLMVIIAKGLAYSMMFYIIRDCPKVTVREALRQSIALMKGSKGRLFVLMLSLLGWFLLTSAAGYLSLGVGWWLPLTIGCSIASVLYVGPYIAITMAGFYHAVKQEGLANGVISEE